MYKSEFLRRNEELIELKRLVRQFSGVVESIQESLHLWKRTYKLDELWEVFWYHEDDEGDIEISAARVGAALMTAGDMVRMVSGFRISVLLDSDNHIDQFKAGYFAKEMLSTRSTKDKISRLEATARDCLFAIYTVFDRQWSDWMRKDSGVPLELVQEAVMTMEELITEVEDHWLRIVSIPSVPIPEEYATDQVVPHSAHALR